MAGEVKAAHVQLFSCLSFRDRKFSRSQQASSLHRHPRRRIARRQSIHVRQHHGPRAVVAELLFVLAAHDGEGVEHVAGGVARQAVEVEVEGIEAGAQVGGRRPRERAGRRGRCR